MLFFHTEMQSLTNHSPEPLECVCNWRRNEASESVFLPKGVTLNIQEWWLVQWCSKIIGAMLLNVLSGVPTFSLPSLCLVASCVIQVLLVWSHASFQPFANYTQSSYCPRAPPCGESSSCTTWAGWRSIRRWGGSSRWRLEIHLRIGKGREREQIQLFFG